MRPAKELLNKPIYTVDEGRLVGKVQDLYLDTDLRAVTGIFLGSQGLLKRKAELIRREDVVLFGVDAVLVKSFVSVTDDRAAPEAKTWLLREKLLDREADTPGGIKLGKIGDVLLDDAGRIKALWLSKVTVEGPLAETRELDRSVVLDTGAEDGRLTVDLAALEQHLQGEPRIEILTQPPAKPAKEPPPDDVIPVEDGDAA